jgi:hypothetical protein
MKTWAELFASGKEECIRVLEIVIRIGMHGVLILIWMGLDRAVAYGAERLRDEHESPDFVINAFRWIGSIVILCLAALPAISDVIQSVGYIWRKGVKSFTAENTHDETQPGAKGTGSHAGGSP